MINYSPVRGRGVAVKHAALSRPRSRVRIPSLPPSKEKAAQAAFFIVIQTGQEKGSNPALPVCCAIAPAKQRKSCASGFFYCHPDRAGKGFESRTSSVLRDRSRQAKKKLRKRLFLLSPRPGGKRVRIPHFQCAARSLPPSKEKAAQAAFFIVTQTGRWEILSL